MATVGVKGFKGKGNVFTVHGDFIALNLSINVPHFF